MNKTHQKLIILSIILVIFSSFLLSPLLFIYFDLNQSEKEYNNYSHDNLIKIYPSGSQWGTSSFSIQDGDNLYQNHEYEFTGLYYNDSDYTSQYSDALIEVRDIWGNYENYTISDLTTLYSEYYDSIYNYSGSYSDDSNLDSDDNNLATFFSTNYQTVVSNINPIYGSLLSSGDLEYIDSDYSEYESNTEYDMFDGSYNVYNGSIDSYGDYEFIDSNYTIINSTAIQTNYADNNNLTIYSGTQDTIGDLESIDGNYTIINSTEAGHYPATYSFYNETGESGTNISFVDASTFATCIVEHEKDGHKDVLKTISSGTYQTVDNTFSSQTTGIIEFWIYCEESNKARSINIRDTDTGNNEIIIVFRSTGKISNYVGTSYFDFADYSADTWHHLKMQFYCSNHTYDIWVDGTSYGNKNNYGSYANVEALRFNSWADSGETTWWDAIGYSWDTNYTIGDNLVGSLATINATIEFNSNLDIASAFYSYNTSISQNIEIYFWNYDTLSWYLFANQSYSSFTEIQFTDFNSSFTDSNNSIKIKFYGENQTNDFQLNIEEFQVRSNSYLNVSMNYQLDLELRTIRLLYSYATNISQTIAFSIYNFDDSNYELLRNESFTSFAEYIQSINSSYYNSSHYVMFNFYGLNATDEFQLQIEELKVQNSPKMILEINQTSLLYENLVYSYKTNISQIINFSIYNFDTLSYEILNSSYVGDFALFIFGLNSSYYNGSAICMQFTGINTTFYEFTLQIEVMKIRDVSYLNTSILFNNVNYDHLLQLEVWAEYMSNITQMINFSIYKLTNYDLIDSGSYTSLTQFQQVYNSSDVYDYINSSYAVELNFYGENITHPFRFDVDYLYLKLYEQLELSYDIGFGVLGAHRYRFWVRDSEYSIWVSSEWIDFNIVDPATHPNLKLISESPYTTDWTFIGVEGAGIIDLFEEDFSSSNWISDNSEEITISGMDDDSYVWNDNPNSNYGSSSNVYTDYWVTFEGGPVYHYRYGYFQFFPNGYIEDYSRNYSFLNIYCSYEDATFGDIHLYETGLFDEDTINWNNKPADGVELYSNITIAQGSYKSINLTDLVNSAKFSTSGILQFHSKEGSNEPYFSFYLYRYKNKNGYVYIQSNQSESINLKSPDNLDLELQEGDRIEITYNTSSSNRIDLNLLNNNVTQKSFILSSQGNSIFTDQTDTLIIDSDYTVDQLEFSSLFDATNNLIVKNIHIYRYNSSTSSYTYKVDPDGSEKIYLNFPIVFSYYVYENGLEVLSGNITTTDSLQTISYERIDQNIIYINYYDTNNEHLNFQDYTTYVNFTYQGSSVENRRLSSAIMYADEETQIEFQVYDSFNSLIKTSTKNVQTFVDLELPVYELKIKSAAEEYVAYSLESNDTFIEKSGMIFPEEIIKFSIASGDYILTYTNYEDEVERTYEFTLSDNKLITINTTYYQTYLGAYIVSNNETLPWNEVKFYINGSRSDFGFNTLTSDYVQLTILDYFNNTLYNETKYLRGQMEYDMFVDISKLIIQNNYRHRDITVIIREGNITRTEIINPLQSKTLQLAPNTTYSLTTTPTLQALFLDYYLYGVFLPSEIRTVTLSGESQVVDFGFYKTEVASTKPITDLATQMIFIVFFFSTFAIITVVVFMYLKKVIDDRNDELGNKRLDKYHYHQRAQMRSETRSLISRPDYEL